MTKVVDDAWKVLPHGTVETLADNLWWVQGTVPRMSLKRVMTVARTHAGELVIHNGIALDEASMQRLEAWGRPAYLLVPNGMHRLDAPAYKRRYPQLRVFTPRASRKRVSEVVAVDGAYEDFPPLEDVKLRSFPGADADGVMLVRSPDGVSLVLNDLVFNMDRVRDPLGFVITTLLGSAPGPRISRLAKWALIKDRPAVKRELTELSRLPELQRLIVSHDKIARGPEARQALEQAISYL